MTEALMDRHVVALTPADVPQAQASLIGWCREKIATLGTELREQRQNLRQAKQAKWKHSGWQAQVTRTKDRMVYYAKIKAALAAGYLIVPNFETEVMAVRVQREEPLPKQEDAPVCHYGKTQPSNSLVRTKPELLPPGVGRYVDDVMFYKSFDYAKKNEGGKEVQHRRFTVSGYDAPDFPVLAIKPVVLEATQRAMALNLFDRIGVVTGRKQDPLVLGEIIDPRANLSWLPSQQKRVSFFIAWWLNTQDL